MSETDGSKFTAMSKFRDQASQAQFVAQQISGWFEERLEGAENLAVTNIVTPKSGLSADTFILTLKWQEVDEQKGCQFVVRSLPDEPLFLNADLISEAKILKAIGDGSNLPVPKVRWIEKDEQLIGRAFYVMDWVAGRVPSDVPIFLTAGWVVELQPEMRARLWKSGIHFLADLHNLGWRELGLPPIPGRDASLAPLDAELEYLRAYHDWSTGGEWPDLTQRLFQWLKDNRPEDVDTVLCWGDARPGNMIFSDEKCEAALDWEMATLCDPSMDVAYWIHTDNNYRGMSGLPLLEGMPEADEVVRIYEERSGRKVRNLNYYLGLCAFRSLNFFVKAGEMLARQGDTSMTSVPLENTPMAAEARQVMGEK